MWVSGVWAHKLFVTWGSNSLNGELYSMFDTKYDIRHQFNWWCLPSISHFHRCVDQNAPSRYTPHRNSCCVCSIAITFGGRERLFTPIAQISMRFKSIPRSILQCLYWHFRTWRPWSEWWRQGGSVGAISSLDFSRYENANRHLRTCKSGIGHRLRFGRSGKAVLGSRYKIERRKRCADYSGIHWRRKNLSQLMRLTFSLAPVIHVMVSPPVYIYSYAWNLNEEYQSAKT